MPDQIDKQIIMTINSVQTKSGTILIQPTDIQKSGAFSQAFEFADEKGQKYFLKITGKQENISAESRILSRIHTIFKNEVLSEPDIKKRLNYIPAPQIIADTPEAFSEGFARSIDRGKYWVQLQTSGIGRQCDQALPAEMKDRILILIDFAKTLRLCAVNKIAYLDIKPLEHLFWEKSDERMQISIIDWGNATINASALSLEEDIRNYCRFIPEIIFGRKMLDSLNRGKMEYPIQIVESKALTKMLAVLSVSGETVPLLQDFAILLSDLCVGKNAEVKMQKLCIEIWNQIIVILEEAATELSDNEDIIVIDAQNEALADFFKERTWEKTARLSDAISGRKISLADHRAWLIPAIKFTQIWYERMDFVPRNEFGAAIAAIGDSQPIKAIENFENISIAIAEKLKLPDMPNPIKASIKGTLELIQITLHIWQTIINLSSGTMDPINVKEAFKNTKEVFFDPILSSCYSKLSNNQENSPSKAVARFIQPESAENQNIMESEKKMNYLSSELMELIKKLRGGLDPNKDFSELCEPSFLSDFNRAITKMREEPSLLAEKEFFPIYQSILKSVHNWIKKIDPFDNYIVSDITLNQINWIFSLSPYAFDMNAYISAQVSSVNAVICNSLSTLQKRLLSEISPGFPLSANQGIGAQIAEIKAMRRKIDQARFLQIQSFVEKENYEAVYQIIGKHYDENPALYDQIKRDMKQKNKETEENYRMALVNTLFSDLTMTENTFETTRFFSNQNNISLISQRILESKSRNTQLFDIQDELGRMKTNIADMKKHIQSQHSLLTATVTLSCILIILLIIVFFSIFLKNATLEQRISGIERSGNQINQAAQTAVAKISDIENTRNSMLWTAESVPLPTFTSTPMPEPTELAPALIIGNPLHNEEPSSISMEQTLPIEDLYLESKLNQEITFDLAGNLSIFIDSDLDSQTGVLGTVINYSKEIRGKLLQYTDNAIQIEAIFNIGRSQISMQDNLGLSAKTYIRMFSQPPEKSAQIFVTLKNFQLSKPSENCAEDPNAFCHGTISFWLERAKVENTIK